MCRPRLWKWPSKKRYEESYHVIKKQIFAFLLNLQFLKKVQRQERIVEEIKMVLKPFYNKKKISKESYKEIMRKCVPKVSEDYTVCFLSLVIFQSYIFVAGMSQQERRDQHQQDPQDGPSLRQEIQAHGKEIELEAGQCVEDSWTIPLTLPRRVDTDMERSKAGFMKKVPCRPLGFKGAKSFLQMPSRLFSPVKSHRLSYSELFVRLE